jgi:hypothetical protein
MLIRVLSVFCVASLMTAAPVAPAGADPIDPEAVHKMANTLPYRDDHFSAEPEDLSDEAAEAALQPQSTKAPTDVLEAARILGAGSCQVLVTLNLGYDSPGGLSDTFEWLDADVEPQCADITDLSLTVSIFDSGLPGVGDTVASTPGTDRWDPPNDVGRAVSAGTQQYVPIGSLEGRAHGAGSSILWFVALEAEIRGQDVAVCWGASARQGVPDITVLKGC